MRPFDPSVGRRSFSAESVAGGGGSPTESPSKGNGAEAEEENPAASRRSKEDHAHCVDLVRDRDMEGYLCGLLMPSRARRSYFAIRAFNVELASVKDGGAIGRSIRRQSGGDHFGTDLSLASRLRMQWWRDALGEIYGDDDDKDEATRVGEGPSVGGFLASSMSASRRHNPVVRELDRAVRESGLTRRFLERMVAAREADLDILQVATLREVLQYGEDTSSSLLYLSLECAGVRERDADIVASHLGVGLGLVTALRSTGYRASRNELSIPLDVMERHAVPHQHLLDPPERNDERKLTEERHEASEEALRNAVREMAGAAKTYIHQARDMQTNVPKAGRSALLPAVSALHYLEKLEALEYDVLHPELHAGEKGRLGVTLLLGRAWLTGVF